MYFLKDNRSKSRQTSENCMGTRNDHTAEQPFLKKSCWPVIRKPDVETTTSVQHGVCQKHVLESKLQ